MAYRMIPVAADRQVQYSLDGIAGVSYTPSVTPFVLEGIYVQANDYEFDRVQGRPPAAWRATQLTPQIGVSTGEIPFPTTDFGGAIQHGRYK